MVRNFYRPMFVIGLLALAGCSGGSMNSSVPGSQALTPQSAAQAGAQTQTRTTLAKDAPKPDGNIVYNSIPSPLHAIPSLGFECCQVKEFGDGVNVTKTDKYLDTVSVVMDSWGCQTGNGGVSPPDPNACHTTPGSTFNVPITLNVYAVCAAGSCGIHPNSRVGALLASQTKTFAIPYRPSASTNCVGGRFMFDICTHGLPNTIVFDNLAPQVKLPSQAIFTVAYNTTTGGYTPTGMPCNNEFPAFVISDSCGYDSLNVGAEGPGGPVGSALDPNGAFVNYSAPSNYCDSGIGGSNFLRLDTGANCWGPQPGFPNGLHPQIQVTTSDKKDNDDKTKPPKHGDND